jgi:hypothetical protein
LRKRSARAVADVYNERIETLLTAMRDDAGVRLLDNHEGSFIDSSSPALMVWMPSRRRAP